MKNKSSQPNNNILSRQKKEINSKIKYIWSQINFPLLLIVSAVSLGLGIIGNYKYITLHSIDKNFGSVLYDSISLFKFSGGPDLRPIPIELEISRWLSPAISMYAVFWAAAKLLKEQLDYLRIRCFHNHIIICGLGDKGSMLAKDYKARGKNVVVIEKNKKNPNINDCRGQGILIINGDAADEFILRKSGFFKASQLILVSDDDNTNAKILLIIKKLSSMPNSKSLRCTVHIKDSSFWSFVRLMEYSEQTNEKLHIDYFNIYDQGARYLLNECSVFDLKHGDDNYSRLIIIGLGKLGEQLIINAVRENWLRGSIINKKIHITIIDKDVKQRIEVLRQKFPLVNDRCELDIIEIDSKDPVFIKAAFLNPDESDIATYIFMCSDDDFSNINSFLNIYEKTKGNGFQVFVPIKKEINLMNIINDRILSDENGEVKFINLLNKECMSLIEKGNQEEIAKVIHEEYLRSESISVEGIKGGSRAFVDWDKLPEDLKEANREQAYDICNKLRVISCKIVPWYLLSQRVFNFSDEEVELLAKNEHDRWCKQKNSLGWKYDPVRDDYKKKHPCLISWDDPRLPESEKEKDRNTIKLIPKYLALAGFQIIRSKDIF